jgi:hypothetical protein
MDLVKKKREDIKAAGNKERPVRPAPGKNRFRILPSWRGAGQMFWRDYGQHWIKEVGAGEGGRDKVHAVFTCKAITDGERCEVCEAIANAKAMAQTDEEVKELKESDANTSILFNALKLDGENPDQPIILTLTRTTADKFFELMDEYGETIIDLDEGIDIVITREGSGLETKYNVIPAAKSKAVNKSVMERLHNLDDYCKEPEEALTKALSAVGVVSGQAPMLSAPTSGSAAAALTGPATGAAATAATGTAASVADATVIDATADVVDADPVEPPADTPFDGGTVVDAAAASEPAVDPAAPLEDDSYGAPVADDDLDAMLASLDGL